MLEHSREFGHARRHIALELVHASFREALPRRDRFKEVLVRFIALDDFSMATPAIVGYRLLIRTQHRLYSIRNRK